MADRPSSAAMADRYKASPRRSAVSLSDILLRTFELSSSQLANDSRCSTSYSQSRPGFSFSETCCRDLPAASLRSDTLGSSPISFLLSHLLRLPCFWMLLFPSSRFQRRSSRLTPPRASLPSNVLNTCLRRFPLRSPAISLLLSPLRQASSPNSCPFSSSSQ